MQSSQVQLTFLSPVAPHCNCRESAIRKLDDTEFKNPFDKCYIRVKEDKGDRGGGGGRKRSPSRSRSRSRDRKRADRSRSRSKSPGDDDKSRSRSRSR